MKRSRFTEEQIIAILKEQEAGVPTVEVCRRHVDENAPAVIAFTSGGINYLSEMLDARREQFMSGD